MGKALIKANPLGYVKLLYGAKQLLHYVSKNLKLGNKILAICDR